MAGCVQRGRERVDDERAHEGRIAEAHLGLRRVHVNVDLVRRQQPGELDARLDTSRAARDLTVRQLMGEYLAFCREKGLRPKTLENYEQLSRLATRAGELLPTRLAAPG